MTDTCSICGRSDGHTPHSTVCLKNQRADLLAGVKELEVEVARVNSFREDLRRKFNAKSDALSEALSHLESLRSQLHQRDTALVAAREALIEAHNYVSGKTKWIGLATLSQAIKQIDHALSQIQEVKP